MDGATLLGVLVVVGFDDGDDVGFIVLIGMIVGFREG